MNKKNIVRITEDGITEKYVVETIMYIYINKFISFLYKISQVVITNQFVMQ